MFDIDPWLEAYRKKVMGCFKGSYIHESELCWVCNQKGSIELHHIVPRAYGGTQGPQTSLCGNCHSGIHNLSFKRSLFDGKLLTANSVLAQLEVDCDWVPEVFKNQKVLLHAWCLGDVVFRARMNFKEKDEPTKRVKIQVELQGEDSSRLKKLARTYKTSQERMVIFAIREAYDRQIGRL